MPSRKTDAYSAQNDKSFEGIQGTGSDGDASAPTAMTTPTSDPGADAGLKLWAPDVSPAPGDSRFGTNGGSSIILSGSGTALTSPETVTFAGSGLVFVNTYDSTVTAGYHTAIIAAENFYQSHFSTTVTINESFSMTDGGADGFVAANSFYYLSESYASLKAALASRATSADDQAAVASLPSADPSNGLGFALPLAEAKALGFWSATDSHVDDTVYLNTSYSYFYNGVPVAGAFDAVSAIEHELSEAMGRVGGLGLNPPSNDFWAPMDLFRYSAPGQRDYTGGGDGNAAYFSVDGTHLLTQFNNPYPDFTTNGDAADWAITGDSYGFATLGQIIPVSATDLRVMDILGWATLSGNQAPVLNAQGGSLTYVKDQAATAIDTAINVSDADSDLLSGIHPSGRLDRQGNGGLQQGWRA